MARMGKGPAASPHLRPRRVSPPSADGGRQQAGFRSVACCRESWGGRVGDRTVVPLQRTSQWEFLLAPPPWGQQGSGESRAKPAFRVWMAKGLVFWIQDSRRGSRYLAQSAYVPTY